MGLLFFLWDTLPSGFVELVSLVRAAALMMLPALETQAVFPHESRLSLRRGVKMDEFAGS